MNQTSVSHNSSSSSDGVLLVLRFLIIFFLGSGNTGVTVHFEVSLLFDSLEDLFKRFFLLFVGLGRSVFDNSVFFGFCFSFTLGKGVIETVSPENWWIVD